MAYGAHLLPPCLDSIARPDPPPDETLVVDDASTDDTRPSCPGIALGCNRRHATTCASPGAVNSGIGAGSGKIVVL